MRSEIYDKKWEEQWGPSRECWGPSFYHRSRVIKKIFNKYSLNGEIMEIGCGDGSLLCQFYGRSNRLYGCDISDKAIQCARSKFGHIAAFDVKDITKKEIQLKNKFDVILCCEVLEHLENDRVISEYLYSLLKPDGYLLISVPHLKKYWSDHDISDNHVRRYEKDTFRDLLQGTGFNVCEIFDWGYPLFHLYYELILKRNKRKINSTHLNNSTLSKEYMIKYVLSKILISLFYIDDLFRNSGKGRTVFVLCRKK